MSCTCNYLMTRGSTHTLARAAWQRLREWDKLQAVLMEKQSLHLWAIDCEPTKCQPLGSFAKIPWKSFLLKYVSWNLENIISLSEDGGVGSTHSNYLFAETTWYSSTPLSLDTCVCSTAAVTVILHLTFSGQLLHTRRGTSHTKHTAVFGERTQIAEVKSGHFLHWN